MYFTFSIMAASSKSVTIIAEEKGTGNTLSVCVLREQAGEYVQLILDGASKEQLAAHYKNMSLNS